MPQRSPFLPVMSFGRETCGDLHAGFRREWLVTNGLGGYASGTLLGVSSRSYHGLLVAAMHPPVQRTVLVGGSVEHAHYAGKRHWIATNEYADGVFSPDGYRNLAEFRLEGTIPVWVYAFGDALLERRLWMVHGEHTTYVTYRVLHATAPVEVDVTPFVTYRDHHALTSGQGWQMQVESQEHGATDRAFEGATPLRLLSDIADFRSSGRWYWNFRYREESARGLNDHGDLYAPGSFSATLEPGQTMTVVYSIEPEFEIDPVGSLAREVARQETLLQQAHAVDADDVTRRLVLAADQFLVTRGATDERPAGRSIIAGYHWFADWSRDTMIALPGLTLATGRPEMTAEILRTYAGFLDGGLLPNNFPDDAAREPEYHAIDAPLWFINAVHAYTGATGDASLRNELLPALVGIVDHLTNGTRYGIAVDPRDGLLSGGEPGLQLTWMDARVDGRVVTPRIGKPVEINALWYNALRIVAAALAETGDRRAADIEAAAERARASFLAKFVSDERVHLADVIEGPDGDDWSHRPNQLLALSLPFPLVEGARARAVLDHASQHLLTSHGLRTLSPDHPHYVGSYLGSREVRDGCYHQGTVWSWWLGPYIDALLRVSGDVAHARALLGPIAHHLSDAGLGTVSEIFDGDPPHAPRGAIAQAWSVAECLRAWRVTQQAEAAVTS